jgi:hypothetical protein
LTLADAIRDVFRDRVPETTVEGSDAAALASRAPSA